MIKTERGTTQIQGKGLWVEAEFSATAGAMKKYLCDKYGMTEEKAEARVMELVEKGFKSQEELNKEIYKEMEKLFNNVKDMIFGDTKEESDEKIQ